MIEFFNIVPFFTSLIEWLVNAQQFDPSTFNEALLGNCGLEFGFIWVPVFGWIPIPTPVDGNCPAASMTAVGAAFSTIGYWVQADLLTFLTFSQINKLAPLLYIFAATGAFIGVAIGAPPKNYVWFVLGPALYTFLIGTTVQVHGVEWVVGKQLQDMRQVWRIAETGLTSTNYYWRANFTNDDPTREGRIAVSASGVPSRAVRVSQVFVWFDSVVSHTVQYMIRWIGVGNNTPLPDSGGDSNIVTVNGGGGGAAANALADNRWYLLTNLKWKFLDNITSAKVADPNLRDAIGTFFGSSCGDAVRDSLEQSSWIASVTSRGTNLPYSVFSHEEFENSTGLGDPGYEKLDKSLVTETRFVRSLKKILADVDDRRTFACTFNWVGFTSPQQGSGQVGSFCDDDTGATEIIRDWLNGDKDGTGWANWLSPGYLRKNDISCQDFFQFIVLALRWEAGQIYHQAFRQPSGLPAAITEESLLYNLFYGWDIRDSDGKLLGNGAGSAEAMIEEYRQFVIDLIFIHLVRNELEFTFVDPRVRRTSNEIITDGVDKKYNSGVASKSKFGELYTWALLVPYLQGVIFYVLAIAYPFACLMMIVPGWHKMLFTWASFWAWAKLWDLGFAIVMSIERSLWAMMGNQSNFVGLAPRILDRQTAGAADNPITNSTLGGVNVTCLPGSTPAGAGQAFKECAVPLVELQNQSVLNVSRLTNSVLVSNGGQDPDMNPVYRLFDSALTLSQAIDLDVINSYYIFLIAGLYLSVPAITGQVVLGAKAGAASLVTSAISGAGSEAAQGAKSTAQSDIAQRVRSSQNAFGQGAKIKALRGGLAAGVFDAQNASADANMKGAQAGQMGQVYSQLGNIHALGNQRRQAMSNYGFNNASFLLGGSFGGGGSSFGERGSSGMGGSGMGALDVGQGDGAANPQAGARGAGGGGAMRPGTRVGAVGRFLGGMGNNSGLPGWAGKLDGFAGGFGRDLVGFAGQQQGLMYQMRANDAVGMYSSASTDQGNRAFQANQQGQGHGQHGQRLGGQAEFEAEMGRWEALNDYANALAPTAGAYGVFPGGLDPGPKPTDMNGMAMSGMLGQEAYQGAQHFNPDGGAFFSNVESGFQGLQQNGSYDALHGQYQQYNTSPAGELASGFHNLPDAVTFGASTAAVNPGETTHANNVYGPQGPQVNGQNYDLPDQLWQNTGGGGPIADMFTQGMEAANTPPPPDPNSGANE
jgi:hypothetical protein